MEQILVFYLKKTGISARNPIILDNIYRIADIVIDISGFSSRDQLGMMGTIQRWINFRLARIAENKIIFMPQSWGPFEGTILRFFMKRLIHDADLIFARERESYKHLQMCGSFEDNKIDLKARYSFSVSYR